MSGSVEIKINTEELKNSEKKLAELSKNIANRKVKLQFNDAQGAVVDELLLAAKQLNDIGVAIATLIKKTETAIANTRSSFTAADDMLAQWFGIAEE